MICYDTDYHNEKALQQLCDRPQGDVEANVKRKNIFPKFWKMLIEIVFPDNDMNIFFFIVFFAYIFISTIMRINSAWSWSLILQYDDYNNINFKAT